MKKILFLLITIVCFHTKAQTIYVNSAATGANNGTSWANAYTSLQLALTSITVANKTIWVASGVYTPDASNRDISFTINHSGTAIYGGFNGTETILSQRNPKINITTLSGDLSGNDAASLLPTEVTRQDNSYHVIKIRGNSQNVIIDGFAINSGNANGAANNSCTVPANLQSYNLRGGAIYANPFTSGNSLSAFVRNCVLEYNSGTDVAVYAPFTPCGVTIQTTDVNFEHCIIKNNYSGGLGAMLFSGSTAFNLFSKGSIVNCLFYNNTGVGASCVNLTTSTFSGGTVTGIDVDIINSTFSNNVGANGNVITMSNASNSRLRNSIIYGNGSSTPLSIAGSGSVLNNSIVEGGQLSATNANPQFTSPSTNDYTLLSNSAAIDNGNNTYISLSTDLNGDARIFNTTVDLGAYEFSGCVAPSNVQVTSITGTSANVTWNSAPMNSDIVAVIAGQPISSGTIISGLTSNAYAFTSLSPSTQYNVYVRANCSSTSISDWSVAATFRTLGPIYVNQAATGNGSGSSWVDAFTTLDIALQNITASITEIRVAQGVYKPSTAGLANPRKASFSIPNGAQIYGGFNGTETTLAQRDPKTNITVLNGDLSGNDNSTINFSNVQRSENVYHVVSLNGNSSNITIDGFTISGGNANGTSDYTLGINSFDDTRAGAIYANTKNSQFIVCDITNCIIEKNTGSDIGVYASISSQLISTIDIDFDRCIIRYNQSSGPFGNLFFTGFKNSTANRVVYHTLTNCLFHNNVTSTTSSQGASCITTYQNATAGGAYSTVYASIINCTFTNNTGPSGRTIAFLYASNTTIRNSILYNNGSTTPLFFLPTSGTIPTGSNNIIQGGQLAGMNVNPLFASATDFQLTPTSPALNVGNNTLITGFAFDLNGDARISNGTVDLGAYEYSSVLANPSLSAFKDFDVFPNPTNSILNISCDTEIKSLELISIEGRLVLESKESKIDISHLQAGLYILKVTTLQDEVGIKKVVKK